MMVCVKVGKAHYLFLLELQHAQHAYLDVPNEELLSLDLGVILNDFNWTASADAADLEASLISELQALEAVSCKTEYI